MWPIARSLAVRTSEVSLMGRGVRQAVAAWLVALTLLTGCGGGEEPVATDPQPSPTTAAGGVSVSCAQYDSATQQCQLLEVVRSSPQGPVQVRTTIDLRAQTLDLDAVSTTLSNAEDRSRLISDMENPELNVVFDSQAQKALASSGLRSDFERLVQLHPDRCRLVRLRGVPIPVCT
jgi:hypothetical protein